jgi:hypothetical protein
MARERGKKRPKPKPPPVCKAILLCDAVLADPFTGKGSVVGIFERFNVLSFPGHTTTFFVYVQMTNGIGRYHITVEIRDDDDQIIARAGVAEMEFEDRAKKGILLIPVPPVPLLRAGAYDFIVFADGQEIDRQQFVAIQIPETPHASDTIDPSQE